MAADNKKTKTTIDEHEVEKFIKMADEWWDQEGKFKPLHKFNPTRISYIREKLINNFNLDNNSKTPLSKLRILDIGCGGGLLCEPLSKLGAQVTGIDAAAKNIKVAQLHAEKSKLDITYSHIDVEEMAKKRDKFDVVLAMEVVEHVSNVDNFIAAAAKCLKKNGLMFIATINRTAKSYAFAIVGAEYILRWLPVGTHMSKFVRKFTDNLDQFLQNIKITFFDERLTSFAAEDIISEIKIKNNKNKKLVDQIAASLILQGALDDMKKSNI